MRSVKKLHSAHQRVDEALNQAPQTLPFLICHSAKQCAGRSTLKETFTPFLVYAVGEMFNVPVANLDVPAAAIGVYSCIFTDP